MADRSPKHLRFDRAASAAAEDAFRRATTELPADLVSDLAREVVSRLSFRVSRVATPKATPSPEVIEELCGALLAEDSSQADAMIAKVIDDGIDIETVYLGYIAGASHRLGEMWENDEASFVDVSLGTGRLYRIVRGLRHVIAPVILPGRAAMPALFALVPGEQHSLGIEMVADLFRRDGGETDVCMGMSHDEIVELAEARHHGVIVLVAHTDRALPALIRLSVALRIVQPLTPIALAGNLVDKNADANALVGAELVITDVKTAIPELRRLTERV